MREQQTTVTAAPAPAHAEPVTGWRRWASYAAIAWSSVYAALATYWLVSGSGFPYAPKTAPQTMGSLIARFGPTIAWLAVLIAGIPAAALGTAMLRGLRTRALRPLFITAGALLAGTLLLLMTDLNLLILLGYTPYAVVGLFTGAKVGRMYLDALAQWTVMHQLLCLIGGFLWLAATVCYGRRSGGACLYCGRRDGPEGWKSPGRAARWCRIAVYVSMVAPVFYAFTRCAWALGFPLGMSQEVLRRGQQSGVWISGLFLAGFGLVGAALTLGLVQRWGEVFPRWMIGLAGRRVPITLAVVPASFVSVLLIVGGAVIWSSLPRMIAKLGTGMAEGVGVADAIIIHVGPTLLFPLWGVALAVAALGYYYRRRAACHVCGRGALA